MNMKLKLRSMENKFTWRQIPSIPAFFKGRMVVVMLAVIFGLATANTVWADVSGDYRSKNTSSTWSTATDWETYNGSAWVTASSKPTSVNNVFIQAGHTMTLTVSEACNDLHISTGTSDASTGDDGKIILVANTLDINGKLRCYVGTVGGNVNLPGTSSTTLPGSPITVTANGAGEIRFVGSSRNILKVGEWAANNTGGTNTFATEIAMTAGQTATMQTAIKTSSLNVSSGTLDAGADVISLDNGLTGQGDVTIGANGTIISSQSGSSASNPVFERGTSVTKAGTLTVNGLLQLTGSLPSIAMNSITINGTVEYANSGSQTLAVAAGSGANLDTYANLKLSGSGTKTLGLNTTVNGTLTMAGTATLSLNTMIPFTLTYGTSSTLSYTGSASQTTGVEFPASSGPNSVTINNSSGVSLAASSSKTINGTLKLNNGTFSVGASTLTLNGPTISGTPANLSTTSSSSLSFGGSSAGVNIPIGITALNNLIINNTSGVSLNSSPTISGTLTLNNGTFFVGANTLTLNGPAIAGTPVNLSTTSASSLVFGGSSAGVNIPSTVTALNNLIIVNASGVTLNSSPTISGTLTLTSGALSIGANTLTLNGAISTTSGSLTGGATSSITFGGSGSTPLPAVALNNLIVNRSGVGDTISLGGVISVGGTLTLTSGALSIGANTLTLNGAISTSSGTLTGGSTSSVSFGGSGASTTLPAVVSGLQNLTVNRGNGIAIGSAVTIGGMLTLSSGQVTSAGNLTLGSGATISIDTGSLDAKPAVGANLNVIYTGSTAATIGTRNEIPTGGNLGSGLLTVNDTGGGTLDSTAGTVSCSGGAVGGGATLTVTTGGILKNAGTFTPTGALSFTGSGKYQHNLNGGTIPAATWASGSTCVILGAAGHTTPIGLNQAFGNFTWNWTAQDAQVDIAGALGGGSPKAINGSLTLQSANGNTVVLNSSSGSSAELDIGSDIVVNANTLNLTSQSASGVITVKVKGNVTVASGATLTVTGAGAGNNGIDFHFNGSANQTLTISGTFGAATKVGWTVDNGATVTLASGLTVNTGTAGPTSTGGFVTVANGGILDCGTQIISGSGVFTLSSGGTLRIGSTAGITSSGTSGNIQVTSTGSARNFNTAANYTYNGSASQAVGNGLPATVNNLTIANTGSSGNNIVTLAQNTAVNGTFSTTSGTLDLNGKTVTAASAPSLNGGMKMEIVNNVAANSLMLSSGALTYGGTLTVDNSGTLASGNSFQLFTTPGNSFSGWFNSVNLTTPPSGLSWDTNHLATGGVLDVYAFSTTPMTAAVLVSTTATIPASKLANHASSSKAGAVYPTGWSASASGATLGSVSFNGGNLIYTAGASAGSDSFTVTLSDGHGVQTMLVTVTVNPVNAGPSLTGVDDGGHYKITTFGGRNTTYKVQAQTTDSDVTGPWTTISTINSADNGVISWTDSEAITAHQMRIYRLAQ